MKIAKANHKKWALLIGCLLLAASGWSQGWEAAFGGNKLDEGKAVVVTQDGGYVLAGFSESFGEDNDLDAYIVRADIDGNIIWEHVYDEGYRELTYSIVEADAGSFLVVGEIQTVVDGEKNVYLLKVSKEGKQLWSRQYGGPMSDQGFDLARTRDGGYIIVGTTKNTDNGEDNILLIRIDEQGEELWSKQYGDEDDDQGRAVVVLDDGFAFVGNSDNPNGFDKDIVLYKVDTEGRTIWTRRIATLENEEGNDLVASRNGDISITGLINDNSDAFIARFDSDGDQKWMRAFGGPLGDAAKSIIELPNGDLVVVGFTELNEVNVNILLAKLSAAGEIIWINDLGEPSEKFEMGEGIAA
ncbi:MAG: PQQ-binding-like beta-propeller repeat protein, partial [Saprospiraceae bacterium]|nr:PQQ-binding-like beta-propeller repeat protein [Saprospiraceae bacterium]